MNGVALKIQAENHRERDVQSRLQSARGYLFEHPDLALSISKLLVRPIRRLPVEHSVFYLQVTDGVYP